MAVLHGVAAVSELSSSAEEITRVQVVDSFGRDPCQCPPCGTIAHHGCRYVDSAREVGFTYLRREAMIRLSVSSLAGVFFLMMAPLAVAGPAGPIARRGWQAARARPLHGVP